MLRPVAAVVCVLGVLTGVVYKFFAREPDDRIVWVGLVLFLVGMAILIKTRK